MTLSRLFASNEEERYQKQLRKWKEKQKKKGKKYEVEEDEEEKGKKPWKNPNVWEDDEQGDFTVLPMDSARSNAQRRDANTI